MSSEKVKSAVKLGSQSQATKPLVDVAGYHVSVIRKGEVSGKAGIPVTVNKTSGGCGRISCKCHQKR